MTRKLTVAHLTAIDLPPPALIEAAAEAGLDGVGLRLLRVTPDSPGYPLTGREDLAATRRALQATGLEVADVEFLRITPEFQLSDIAALLEVGAELGARHLITAPYDDDLSRLSDSLATVAEAAERHGMRAVLEFFPWTPVPDLATCWQVVQQAGPLPGILLDTLHFDRSGSSLDDIARIPADRFPFLHLADAPRQDSYTTEALLDTARRQRFVPGEGAIDLGAILAALPTGRPIGLEIPDAARAGMPVAQRLRLARQATLGLLAQADWPQG